MTDQPIKKAMNKPKAVGRMVQWAIELSQFDIKYRLRTAVKAQALADFIAEFTIPKQATKKRFGRLIQMDRPLRKEAERVSLSPPFKRMFSSMGSNSNFL